ncbi:hypothetical protein ITJ54_04125 [Curtobacterium sp. VKM Ac-2865]|uniref:hypothetical protein n=1 Tax=Curtobacterium sp. VKM Ac-2865 TaxID=2783817 RepID=UPI00188B4037|nr:hypothetical protein [Curtobacterium sp. VKM Ac-2865]MBF4581850.1 hypothetical protein [Curtobacterium sp. VKM Ac-2865]
MPRSSALPRRSVDRRTRFVAVATLVSFAVAAAARVLVDTSTAGFDAPARYATVPPSGWTAFDTVNVVAVVGASLAGAAVLLFGATLVSAVLHHRGRRLPLVIGAVTLAMVVGAVLAGVVASGRTDFTVVTELELLRTALAGLAVASLPAVVLGAVRARGRA